MSLMVEESLPIDFLSTSVNFHTPISASSILLVLKFFLYFLKLVIYFLE